MTQTAGTLLAEVRQYLHALEATQGELELLYARKRAAMQAARAAELNAIAEAEAQLVASMRQHIARRQQILSRAKLLGHKAETLLDLVASVGGADAESLQQRIEAARLAAGRIRTEGWVQWIVSHRVLHHYNDLIELIAHSGQRAPTYDARQRRAAAPAGGAILDATA